VRLLGIEGLHKRFGGVRALKGVSLEVGARETVGLIGPNGSGKTTLVNCVSGVFAATEGRVLLGEDDVTEWSRPRRFRAGLVRTYQSLRLFPQLTAAENVQVGLAGRTSVRGRERRARVADALERHGLSRIRRTPVGQLSYGEQRRVELARALISDPSVLVLDEPAAGLGGEETAQLLSALVDAKERMGFATLIIDHDVSLIMGISDRIVVLHEGAVLREGRPEDVARDPEVIAVYLSGAKAEPG